MTRNLRLAAIDGETVPVEDDMSGWPLDRRLHYLRDNLTDEAWQEFERTFWPETPA